MDISRRTALKAGGAGVVALAARPAAADLLPSSLPGATAAVDGPVGSWLLGDTHVHTDHSSDGSGPRQGSNQALPGNVPSSDQIRFAEAAGLDWLPLTDHRSYDQHWMPDWRSDVLLLVPGEEANGSPHATVHGHVEQRVDGANPPGSAGYRHVQQSVWDIRSQDAVWTTAHPDDGEVAAVRPDGSVEVNPNAETLGVHNIEILNSGDSAVKIAYAEDRWNAGWRTGVVAASDSHFKELWAAAGPGQPATRVFARDRTERALLDALADGRTTVSAAALGPVVTLLADLPGGGVAMGGDEVAVPAGGSITLRVRVERAPGLSVQVWAAPGRSAGPVATLTPTGPDETFQRVVTVPEGRAWFRADVVDPVSGRLLAMVSPLFTTTDGPAAPLAALPVPPPLGLRDAAVPLVGGSGRFAGFPDVARVPDGLLTVAEVHADGTTRVVAVGPDGTVTDLAPDSASARFPRVAADGVTAFVVWQDERAGQVPRRPAVYCRRSDDGGRTWQPAERLSSGAGRAVHPVVAAGSGRAVAAWSDNAGTGAFDVLVREIGSPAAARNVSSAGKLVDPGSPADSRSPRYPASLFPALALGPDGSVAVVWGDNRYDPDPLFTGHTDLSRLDDDSPVPVLPDSCPGAQCSVAGTAPDDWEVLVATCPPGGSFGAPVRVAPDSARADRHPDVVYDDAGDLVVVWDTKELRASGANVSVQASRSTDGGRSWSAAVAVGALAEAMSERPRLAPAGPGRTAVVWQDTRSADWRWSVQRAVLDGGAWGPAQRLTGDGNATWPAACEGAVVFASDRQARPQRDRTQQVLLLPT